MKQRRRQFRQERSERRGQEKLEIGRKFYLARRMTKKPWNALTAAERHDWAKKASKA